MADPIDELMAEHRTIEKVLAALDAVGNRPVDFEFYDRAIEFIAHFADGCHHEKEERQLFPRLEELGLPREGGPIGQMLHEHESGRAHVQAMRRCLAERDLDGLRREARGYTALLAAHIKKEDQVLFPMARGLLSDEEMERLQEGFDAVEVAVCDHYRAEADALLTESGG